MKNELKNIEKYSNLSYEEINEFDKKVNSRTITKSIIYITLSLCLLVFTIIVKKSAVSLSIFSYEFLLTIILTLLISTIFIISYFIFSKKLEVNYKLLVIKKIILKVFEYVSFICNILIVLSIISLFIITPTSVSGSSMNPTYNDDDKVLIWHLNYNVVRDDVVVIETTLVQDVQFIIKRVVGVYGDNVEYINGFLYINGKQIQEMDLETFQMCLTDKANNTKLDYIPEGYCIALGDNRSNSLDSRVFGLVKNEDVIGKAIFTFFPFSSLGIN